MLSNSLVDAGRGDAEIFERGRRLLGEASEPFHRRSELFEESGEVGEVLGERAALVGGRLGDRLARC